MQLCLALGEPSVCWCDVEAVKSFVKHAHGVSCAGRSVLMPGHSDNEGLGDSSYLLL